MSVQTLSQRFYSDRKFDGTSRFYDWVREYARPEMRLLNLGAGPATKNPIRILKGQVAHVAGADVDDCVLANPELDEAVLIRDGKLPFADDSFDIAISDYVFEHVDNGRAFLKEAHRVMKPGASLFFRTPSIWHYVAIISAMTPHRVHSAMANYVRGNPKGAQEPWRTRYRLNSRARVRTLAREVGFTDAEFRMIEAEPSYLKFNAVLFLGGVAYERLVNSTDALAGLRANIFGRLTK